MVHDILSDRDTFLRQIAELKRLAPEYPELHIEGKDGAVWATTMVTFSHNNLNYKRHHVQSIVPDKQVTVQHLIKRIHEEAQKTIKFGLPIIGMDELVSGT